MTSPLLRLATLLAGLSAAGCAAPCLFDVTGDVSVTSTPDANRGYAVAIDVVGAQGATLVDRLGGLDAGAWFAQRDQLLRDNPTTLTVSGWEIAPGQEIGPDPLRFACGQEALFVFASMAAPGPHRVRLDTLKDVTVTIGPETIEVTQ